MRSKSLLFLLALLLGSAPGCWDIRDVNNVAFAITLGIDKPKNPNTAKYKVTLEFAEPVVGKPTARPRSLVVSAEEDSMLEAIQRIQAGISRTISLSHLRAVVVGESLAKQEEFGDFVNYLWRNPEVALRLRLVFVQNNEAQALLHTKRRYAESLGAELVAMGETQMELALVRTSHFYNFTSELNSNNGTTLGSRVVIQPKTNYLIREGAAVYENRKLIGWLTADETQATNWLNNKSSAVVVAKEKNNKFLYQVKKQKVKITPIIKDKTLRFVVKVATDGMVMEEAREKIDLSKMGNLQRIEALVADTIAKQIRSAISKSRQELKTDYLGFGQILKQYYPKLFPSLNWKEVYPTVPIEVSVSCKVGSYGLHT